MMLRGVSILLVIFYGVGWCYSENTLTDYIHRIKMRPGMPIEPIPKQVLQEKLNYSENDSQRSPFLPVLQDPQANAGISKSKKLRPTLASDLVQINYAKANEIAHLLQDKNSLLLSKRGSLTVDARTNMLWIKDSSRRIQKIKEVVEQLDIPVKQVQIEARIVNVTKEAILDLGIRFGISNPSNLSGTLNGANQLLQGVAALADRLNMDFGAPVPNPASIGIALAKLGDGILLDLELSALESEDKAEIVANPRLVAANQQAAVIESGEEIPYQEATLSGATAGAFKKAVLSLKVTPQITPDNRLLMEIEINQDSPSGRLINGVPAINTKAIHTVVLVNNGQTLVLGGIYKQDKNNTVKRVPFLGNLPIIGALFRNLHRKVKNEELLIFITPRIITNNLSIAAIQGEAENKNFDKARDVNDYSKIVHNEVID